MSAFVTKLGISLGQLAVSDKKNEIVEIPGLLKELQIKGIMTIDTMGCQRRIVEMIVSKKANYIFQVKENQQKLLEGVREGCEKQVGKVNFLLSIRQQVHHPNAYALLSPVSNLFLITMKNVSDSHQKYF